MLLKERKIKMTYVINAQIINVLNRTSSKHCIFFQLIMVGKLKICITHLTLMLLKLSHINHNISFNMKK